MDAIEKARELAQAADRGEAPSPAVEGGAGPSSPQAPPDESGRWVAAALQFGDVARQALPEHAAKHWTDARLQNVGKALARCAQHYGWKFGGLINHPLAGLAAACFPLAWPLAEPYVMRQVKREQPAPPPAAEAAPAEPEGGGHG